MRNFSDGRPGPDARQRNAGEARTLGSDAEGWSRSCQKMQFQCSTRTRLGAWPGKRRRRECVYKGASPTAGHLNRRQEMKLRRLTLAALLALLPAIASAQDAGPVVAAASKAMGADSLNSITY